MNTYNVPRGHVEKVNKIYAIEHETLITYKASRYSFRSRLHLSVLALRYRYCWNFVKRFWTSTLSVTHLFSIYCYCTYHSSVMKIKRDRVSESFSTKRQRGSTFSHCYRVAWGRKKIDAEKILWKIYECHVPLNHSFTRLDSNVWRWIKFQRVSTAYERTKIKKKNTHFSTMYWAPAVLRNQEVGIAVRSSVHNCGENPFVSSISAWLDLPSP